MGMGSSRGEGVACIISASDRCIDSGIGGQVTSRNTDTVGQITSNRTCVGVSVDCEGDAVAWRCIATDCTGHIDVLTRLGSIDDVVYCDIIDGDTRTRSRIDRSWILCCCRIASDVCNTCINCVVPIWKCVWYIDTIVTVCINGSREVLCIACSVCDNKRHDAALRRISCPRNGWCIIVGVIRRIDSECRSNGVKHRTVTRTWRGVARLVCHSCRDSDRRALCRGVECGIHTACCNVCSCQCNGVGIRTVCHTDRISRYRIGWQTDTHIDSAIEL